MDVLNLHYKIEEDWNGELYCGTTLKCNYEDIYVDISMPNYVKKKLTNTDTSPLNAVNTSHISQIPSSTARIWTNLHTTQSILSSAKKTKHSRRIDLTILNALSDITIYQINHTERTVQRIHQLLYDMHTNPNAIIHFKRSDTILNIHSNASYLSAERRRSCAGGFFFLR